MSRTLGPITGLIAAGLVIAACGGGAHGAAGTGTSGQLTGHSGLNRLGFVVCMRAHGVPDLPDPTANGVSQAGDQTLMFGIAIPSTVNVQSPAFQTADRACQNVLRNGVPPPPPITAATKAALIANAQCMRTHGVPDYPDPQFPAAGGIEIFGGPNDNPQAPAYQRAVKTCGTGR